MISLAELGGNAFEQHDVGARDSERLGAVEHAARRPLRSRPCTRKPPVLCTDCGFRPRCAHTAMSWRARNSTISSWPAPLSSFTISAPPSCMRRTEFASAMSARRITRERQVGHRGTAGAGRAPPPCSDRRCRPWSPARWCRGPAAPCPANRPPARDRRRRCRSSTAKLAS